MLGLILGNVVRRLVITIIIIIIIIIIKRRRRRRRWRIRVFQKVLKIIKSIV